MPPKDDDLLQHRSIGGLIGQRLRQRVQGKDQNSRQNSGIQGKTMSFHVFLPFLFVTLPAALRPSYGVRSGGSVGPCGLGIAVPRDAAMAALVEPAIAFCYLLGFRIRCEDVDVVVTLRDTGGDLRVNLIQPRGVFGNHSAKGIFGDTWPSKYTSSALALAISIIFKGRPPGDEGIPSTREGPFTPIP